MVAQNNLTLSDRLAALKISPDEFQVLQRLHITIDDLEKLHQSVLWKTIQAKLQRRRKNATQLYGLLMGIKQKKFTGAPNDRITNPLATDYRLQPAYTDVVGKRALYNAAVENNAVAYTDFNKLIPLGALGAEFNDVEYIGGLWRVQNKFYYDITNVRDRQFVLMKKLPYNELTGFEFYSAASVVWSANGPSADIDHAEWIVAKYKTARGVYWAYGRTIEEVRAFLGVDIYYKNKHDIDSMVLMRKHQK